MGSVLTKFSKSKTQTKNAATANLKYLKVGEMMIQKIFQQGALAATVVIAMNAMAQSDESVQIQALTNELTSELTNGPEDSGVLASATITTAETVNEAQVEDLPIKTPLEGEAMFRDCALIVSDSARLACFDDIAQGKVPTILHQKQPIALGETIKSITGSRQVIFVDNKTTDADGDTIKRNIERYTPLSISYDLDRNSEQGLWRVRPHNPVYILPMYLHGKPNRKPSTPTQEARYYTANQQRAPELKFQVSLKSKMMDDVFGTNADLWFGYTHMAHWQIYNEDNSRPFRAHDYEPEMFLTQPVSADLPFGGRLRMLGAGVVHHSNGEDNLRSRSWNRAYAMAGMEWGNLTVMPRLWARILKEGNGAQPDDNPDVLDYYGHGDVKFLYQLQNNKNISGLVRYNPKTGKGALQLDYVHPLGKGISGYVQLFQGYGQSFIDYNHEATSIGVGVMLNDWMGL